MHPRRRAFIVLNICGAVVLAGTLLFLPLRKHSHRESPDGHFLVVVRTQPIYALIPLMPGETKRTNAGGPRGARTANR